jgi:hypothetical protein
MSLSHTWIVTTMSLHTMSVIMEGQGRDGDFHDGEDKNGGLSLRYSHESSGSPSAIAQ